MLRRLAIAALSLLACLAAPAHANSYTVVTEWVEVPAGRLVEMAPPPAPTGIAAFGPFRVLDARHAALVDVTDHASPAQFKAMLAAFPGIATLEMLDCPGTYDDIANLKVGRMLHAAGIETHVPSGGSVRSGAVELFVAGARRRIDDGAQFAVHAWEGADGKQAGDFAEDAPVHQTYLAFYREMGMGDADARAFYAMTNSVPFERALWLDAAAMRRYIATSGQTAVMADADAAMPAAPATQVDAPAWVEAGAARPAPMLAYLDVSARP